MRMANSSRWFMSLVLCGAAVGLAQTPDPSRKALADLLARVNSNWKANGILTEQYTSDEIYHNRNFDKKGKTVEDETAKYENVFVEGLPYRRKVEENGKPLSEKTAAAEEKRFNQAVEERRKMSLEEKRRGLHFGFHSSLPICCLLTLFDNRIVRHETVNGRDAAVVESVPKPNAKPANKDEETSLGWKETTWIDAEESVPARIEVELLEDRGHMSKGMTIRMDFVRLIDTPASDGQPERSVWLQSDSISHLQFKVMWYEVSGITEQTWSNFKKFHVDMRLLEDSVQEVPGQQVDRPQ